MIAKTEESVGALLQTAEHLAATGRMAEAAPVFSRLTALEPDQPLHRYHHGMALLELEDYAAARTCFEQVCEPLATLAGVWLGLGLANLRLGEPLLAARQLRQARQRDPGLAVACIFEAQVHAQYGDREAATAALAAIRDDAELCAEDYGEWVQALFALQEYAAAERVLGRALQRFPGHAVLRLAAAHLLERANQLTQARAMLAPLPVDAPGRALLEARLQSRSGEIAAAIANLQRLHDAAETPAAMRAQVDFELGSCLDRRGDYAAAWAAFSRGNQRDREDFIARFPAHWAAAQQREQFADPVVLDALMPNSRATPTGARPAPIFVVGFPRSGTTLLDAMLEAHPSLQVIEEKPLLEPAMAALLRTAAGQAQDYATAVAALSEEDLQRMRASYWQQVSRYAGATGARRVVDKNPFNLLRVHWLLRLFPDATWLFAIRHPLDVLLSCYTKRMQFTSVTRGFWSIEDIAEVYRDAIGLWLRQRQRLQLHCVDLRYEALVQAPEMEMRRVLQELGLPWDAGVLQHEQRARARWIATPSYDQVIRPVYREADGRWRRYAEALAPAAAIVAPVQQTLGYAVF